MTGEHLACGDAEDYIGGEAARIPDPGSRIPDQQEFTTSGEDRMGDIGMSVETALGMEEAEAAIREALAGEGFGVLTEIDVQATLKQKIDVDRAPYKILGACNPHLANQAINHDEAIGLLLPCNVTLSDTGSGTRVAIIDPLVMLASAGEAPDIQAVAAEAKAKLERALAAVPAS